MQVQQDAKFKLLEQKVENRINQMEAKVGSAINQFEYRIASKLHQLDKNFSGQLNTIRKDHFHSDKRFKTLVENVKEIINLAGQHIGKLNDHFFFIIINFILLLSTFRIQRKLMVELCTITNK